MRPFMLTTLLLVGLASPVGAQPRREQVLATRAHAEVLQHINQLATTAAIHLHHGVANALLATRSHVDDAFDPVASAPLPAGTKIKVIRQAGGSRFELPNGGHVVLWTDALRMSEPRANNTTAVHDIEVANTISLSRQRVVRADQSVIEHSTLLSMKGKNGTVSEHTIGGPAKGSQP